MRRDGEEMGTEVFSILYAIEVLGVREVEKRRRADSNRRIKVLQTEMRGLPILNKP